MNPTQTSPQNVTSNENLLEKAFENTTLAPVVTPREEVETVAHSEEHLKSFRNDWAEFMSRRTEVTESPALKPEVQQTVVESIKFETLNEGPVAKLEVQQMFIEQQFKPYATKTQESNSQTRSFDIINQQKGSASAWTESGLKILPDVKDVGKSLFGALNIFKEIFMDTAKLLVKSFTEKFLTPEEAKKAAEKKAEQKKKNSRIQDFYNAMAAQMTSTVRVDAIRMETTEKENINKTVKLNTSYKGIKDAAGRLTVYAASMFEREQLDEEKRMKKIEKQQKMASAGGKGPDLNMDKVAEGGFLSSTGGQGAG